MVNTFPSDTVSVIVLPSGEDGKQVLELAESWTGAWLLGPAFWIECDQIPLESDGPPKVLGWMLGRDEKGQPTRTLLDKGLFWALGAQRFKLIRLVAVRSQQNKEAQDETTQKVRLLAQYLDAARPGFFDRSKASDVGTDYKKLNLVFAPTSSKNLIPKSVVEMSWDANIIASAEDRPLPGSFDSFVVRNERYAGFVLAHIACAAGIWSGLPKSTYEFGSLTHPNLMRARMQRVFVRAVASDKLSADLAVWALDTSTGINNEPSLARIDERVKPIIGDDVNRRIDEVVEYLLDGVGEDTFRFKELPAERWAASPARGLLEKIVLRVNDVIEAIRFIRPWLNEMVSRRIDNDDSEAERYGFMPSRLDPRFSKADLSYYVNKPRPKVKYPSPRIWTRVRETISATIDSPDNIEHPSILISSDGRTRLIFSDIQNVLPDPDAVWTGQEFEETLNLKLERVDWLGVVANEVNRDTLSNFQSQLQLIMQDAARELEETAEALAEAQIAEAVAVKELNQANIELGEDITFAEGMRTDHTHQLPKRMVGPTRPTVRDSEDNIPELYFQPPTQSESGDLK